MNSKSPVFLSVSYIKGYFFFFPMRHEKNSQPHVDYRGLRGRVRFPNPIRFLRLFILLDQECQALF